jgi:amino acid transporter
MNYTSNMPGLWAFALITGGPAAALSNWIMVGGLASIVSLSMAEIAAAMPTAGGKVKYLEAIAIQTYRSHTSGIYFWSYRLGGKKWGPFLAWMTAWWNWYVLNYLASEDDTITKVTLWIVGIHNAWVMAA